MAKVKLGGSMKKRGPGLRPPLKKTPKYRMRQKLRAHGFSKKQAFRITSNIAKGGRSRSRQLGGLKKRGFGRPAMRTARSINYRGHPKLGGLHPKAR